MTIKEVLSKAKYLKSVEQKHIDKLKTKFVPFFENVSEVCLTIGIKQIICLNFISSESYNVRSITYEPIEKQFHIETYQNDDDSYYIITIDLDAILGDKTNDVNTVDFNKVNKLMNQVIVFLQNNLICHESYVSNLGSILDKI